MFRTGIRFDDVTTVVWLLLLVTDAVRITESADVEWVRRLRVWPTGFDLTTDSAKA